MYGESWIWDESRGEEVRTFLWIVIAAVVIYFFSVLGHCKQAHAATLTIDLMSRSFTLADDGSIIRTGPISAARKGMVTPKGMFKVHVKQINGYSRKYHAPMPYSVFFNRNIAAHAGYIPANRAGTSHGCVHLTGGDAKFVYEKIRVGDIVNVQ